MALETRPLPALLDIEDVARILGVEIVTVRRMINRGELPAIVLGDNRRGLIRIRPTSLERTLTRWESRSRS